MAFEHVILRTAEGQQYGPVPMAEILEWDRQRRVPRDATLVDAVSGETRVVAEFPGLVGAAYGSVGEGWTRLHDRPSGTNPRALWSACCAGIGLLPCFGLFLGLPAVILGVLGIRDARRLGLRSRLAWVGIVGGALDLLLAFVGWQWLGSLSGGGG